MVLRRISCGAAGIALAALLPLAVSCTTSVRVSVGPEPEVLHDPECLASVLTTANNQRADTAFYLPRDTRVRIVYQGEGANSDMAPSLVETYHNDCVEFYIDTDGTDRQLRFVWGSRLLTGKSVLREGVTFAQGDPSDTEYCFELALPWKSLGIACPGEDGSLIVDCSAIGLKAAVSGTGVQPQAGQQVIAVGNPLGDLGGSVAVGYIAASNRTVMVGDRKMDLIQLDMSLNAGNSGGGLFDLRGALIGIVNAKSLAPDAEGIGFAIPLSDAMTAAVGIMEQGYAPGRVDTDMLRFKEVSSGGAMASGLYVSDNSGAEVIPEGAYIVEVDGKTISTRAQWVALLNEKAVNETIRITYEKDGTVSTETVTLPEKKSCDWEYRRG